jgi:hypothetical protein
MVMKLLSFPCGAARQTPHLSHSLCGTLLSLPRGPLPKGHYVAPSCRLAILLTAIHARARAAISSALMPFQSHHYILTVLRHPPSLSCGSLSSSPSFVVASRPSSLALDPPRASPLLQSHNSFARVASHRHGRVRCSPLIGLVLVCGWERGGGVSGGEGGGGSRGLERVEALGGHEVVVEVTVGGGRGGHREGDGGEERAVVHVEGRDTGALLGPWDLRE